MRSSWNNLKEAGLIMIPSWAARHNVEFEMGLTALRRLMTHDTVR